LKVRFIAMKPVVSVAELSSIPNLLLVDVRSGAMGREAYAKQHLVGALHADLDHDLAAHTDNAAQGGRHPLPAVEDFARWMGRMGITPTTSVVAYDDQGGANAAARLWWMLRAVGHSHAGVLDGGFQKAVAEGVEANNSVVSSVDVGVYPVSAWSLPMADIETVNRVREDSSWHVVDVRAGFRYRGEREPIDPVAGRIPGAINLPYEDNLRADKTWREPEELRERFHTVLGENTSRVIVHCGSGVTACHTLLALAYAGMDGAALYVGSWGEWCRQVQRPVAVG
jgi:thiosulfate/3-mercaptopyruvate sulfurtransferase